MKPGTYVTTKAKTKRIGIVLNPPINIEEDMVFIIWDIPLYRYNTWNAINLIGRSTYIEKDRLIVLSEEE